MMCWFVGWRLLRGQGPPTQNLPTGEPAPRNVWHGPPAPKTVRSPRPRNKKTLYPHTLRDHQFGTVFPPTVGTHDARADRADGCHGMRAAVELGAHNYQPIPSALLNLRARGAKRRYGKCFHSDTVHAGFALDLERQLGRQIIRP